MSAVTERILWNFFYWRFFNIFEWSVFLQNFIVNVVNGALLIMYKQWNQILLFSSFVLYLYEKYGYFSPALWILIRYWSRREIQSAFNEHNGVFYVSPLHFFSWSLSSYIVDVTGNVCVSVFSDDCEYFVET